MGLGIGIGIGIPRTSGEGVGVPPADLAVFADGTDGFLYDFSKLSKLWKDTAATTPVAAAGDGIARSDDSSPRSRNATQATAAAQPKYQTGGLARFDGSDDNLLTTLLPGASMTFGFKATVGAGASGRDVIGVSTAGGDRGFLGFDASGRLGGGVGTQNKATIFGGSDVRGTTGVGFLTCSGSVVRLYWQGSEIYSGGQSGNPTVLVGIGVGAVNLSGTGPTSFFPGDLYHALAIKKALTAAQIAAITTLWGTS